VILHIDHVTVVVQDIAKAKAFFSLLGFVEEKSVIISGPTFARYMAVEGIEAEHVTLVSKQPTLGLKFSFCDTSVRNTSLRPMCKTWRSLATTTSVSQ
jgi:catechol 2,3-dioxygenase-like lactoylglutathione lyase family enzyme